MYENHVVIFLSFISRLKRSQLEVAVSLVDDIQCIVIFVVKDLDEQTIQNIETTFKQFNAFLDLLNEKGSVTI